MLTACMSRACLRHWTLAFFWLQMTVVAHASNKGRKSKPSEGELTVGADAPDAGVVGVRDHERPIGVSTHAARRAEQRLLSRTIAEAGVSQAAGVHFQSSCIRIAACQSLK